jgi:hypothetical protein
MDIALALLNKDPEFKKGATTRKGPVQPCIVKDSPKEWRHM